MIWDIALVKDDIRVQINPSYFLSISLMGCVLVYHLQVEHPLSLTLDNHLDTILYVGYIKFSSCEIHAIVE